MAFDFHIRSDFDSRVTTTPSCQIDEELHEKLFQLVRSRKDAYPHLMQSAEFAHDSFYETEDLADLIGELTNAMTQLAVHPDLVRTLTALRNLCQEACAAGLLVHGVAD